MCGIIVSSVDIPPETDSFIKLRGPDHMNSIKYNDIYFVHYLLHLTGIKTTQPIIENNIICIFNGEIYNYKQILPNAPSDAYSILEAYKNYGDEFVKKLDGEFAIVLFDFNAHKLFITGDVFKTKPLFYHVGTEIIISSYKSCCNRIRPMNYNSILPNETLIFDLKTRLLIRKYTIYNFDLQQKKNHYDDYIQALEQSIIKRVPTNSIPLVTLSSGLDSGVIACCLHKYNKQALYMTINKNEDINILKRRSNILKDQHKLIDLTANDKNKYKQHLQNYCEPGIWDWLYHPKLKNTVNIINAGSNLGKSKILTQAKIHDASIKILLSGIGADEVMAQNSYYSNGYGNVNKFPEDLTSIFPWKNFYEGSMENYLRSEEYIGGCFSFETRYPFCDPTVVQEFLWLRPELKNLYKGSNYKPALLHYLDTNTFPYCNHKLGFCV